MYLKGLKRHVSTFWWIFRPPKGPNSERPTGHMPCTSDGQSSPAHKAAAAFGDVNRPVIDRLCNQSEQRLPDWLVIPWRGHFEPVTKLLGKTLKAPRAP